MAERIGAKVVSDLSDTSSDAPSGGFAPKRQAYDDWVAREAARKEPSRGDDGS